MISSNNTHENLEWRFLLKIKHGPRYTAVVVIPPVSTPFQCRDSYEDILRSLETATLTNKGWEFYNQGGQRIYVPPWSIERIHIIYEAQVLEPRQERQGEDQRSITLAQA
jgi:hypothetical protein